MNDILRSVLYYPTIDVPSNNWLRQTVLYWDAISSIVPYRNEYKNNQWVERPQFSFSQDIEFLQKEGVYLPVRPETLINNGPWEKLHQFEDEFKALIQTSSFRNKLPHFEMRKKKQLSDHQRLKNDRQPTWLAFRIHRNKISGGLFSFLDEEGLATNRESNDYDDEWFYFEQKTALLYMAVLAKHLADVSPGLTVPGTDDPEYEKIILQADTESEGFECLDMKLLNTLPVPRNDVLLPEILKFKRKRKDELGKFQKTLSDFHNKIVDSENSGEAKNRVTR